MQCYAGTGSAGYDGAATGQGLAFIHSFATSNGTPAQPLLRDVQATGMVCTGAPVREPLGPVLRERRQDCTVGVTAKVDFGVPTTPPNGDPTKKPNQGGFCAGGPGSAGQSTPGTSRRGRNHVGSRERRAEVLTLGWQDKTSGTSCSSPNSGTFGKAAMAYATDDNSGPVGYVKLTASGPNGSTSAPPEAASPMRTRPRAATTATRSTWAWISRWR